MKPTLHQNQATGKHDVDRCWIARVIVRGEHIEGRGSDNWHALEDLADRLSDRLERTELAAIEAVEKLARGEASHA